jgi:hypothetical protein
VRNSKWAAVIDEMGIRHQRYKGVPDDVSNTSHLCHKRIAFVLFFYSEFNKFTDRMLEITGIKSFSETDRRWGSAVFGKSGAAIRDLYINYRLSGALYRHQETVG